jgi:SAM-dependent methyltransferase
MGRATVTSSPANLRFPTDLRYSDRESKMEYVWRKYRPILEGQRILDVGADKGALKRHLDAKTSHWGIGMGGTPDQEIDLETGRLPFDDDSFDTVLCLDVLEHLEQAHAIFDECCRVSKRHVIISLPNAYASFYHMLRQGGDSPEAPMKFYGLPLDPPVDRHRWFFSHTEAERFIRIRGERNGMRVIQIDSHGTSSEGRGPIGLLRRLLKRALVHRGHRGIDLYTYTIWAALVKESAPKTD